MSGNDPRGMDHRPILRESEDGSAKLLVRDKECSRDHARIVRQSGQVVVYDRTSRNGTFVNGRRVLPSEALTLGDGDVVEVGQTFLVFRSDSVRVAEHLGDNGRSDPFETFSPAVASAFARLKTPAAALLILGPTGVGKDLAAQRHHALTMDAGAPYIDVNCAAIPGTLFESELFGVKKGAGADVTEDRDGYIIAADGGTLFLDEIGDLPLQLQPKLLRILQQREVTPLGSTRPQKVEFNLVSATNRDLEAMVRKGTFREDLLARLNAVQVSLPSLVDRREDLGLLIATILHKLGRPLVSFTAFAARCLMLHSWPRNIRELENVLTSALFTAGESLRIDVEHLSEQVASVIPDEEEAMEDTRGRLQELLEQHHGNISAVARAMGKHRPQIQRWCARFKIDPASYRTEACSNDERSG